jgi:hypothetical protein
MRRNEWRTKRWNRICKLVGHQALRVAIAWPPNLSIIFNSWLASEPTIPMYDILSPLASALGTLRGGFCGSKLMRWGTSAAAKPASSDAAAIARKLGHPQVLPASDSAHCRLQQPLYEIVPTAPDGSAYTIRRRRHGDDSPSGICPSRDLLGVGLTRQRPGPNAENTYHMHSLRRKRSPPLY